MRQLEFKRVSYGKKDTPDEMKEYKQSGIPGSPVGTISEILDMIKTHKLNINSIVLEDLDGSRKVIEVK